MEICKLHCQENKSKRKGYIPLAFLRHISRLDVRSGCFRLYNRHNVGGFALRYYVKGQKIIFKIVIFADIPDHLSGGLFLKGNVVQELLDFISKECQIKLGENLHWARRERLLSIEDAAKKAECSVEDIDALETGRKGLDLMLVCKLLKLYKERLYINVESYND